MAPMAIDSYLDRVCAGLSGDPAEVSEIRDELLADIEGRVNEFCTGGMDPEEAIRLTLQSLGEPDGLRLYLGRVHQGDPAWRRGLKGLGVGILLGCLVGLIFPLGGPLEMLARLFVASFGTAAARYVILLNALLVGGSVGAWSAVRGRSLFVGWLTGSFVWLVEYVMAFVVGLSANSDPVDPVQMLNAVLLAPVIGGGFGLIISLGASVLLSGFSQFRPKLG
jgi:hypothetical protein